MIVEAESAQQVIQQRELDDLCEREPRQQVGECRRQTELEPPMARFSRSRRCASMIYDKLISRIDSRVSRPFIVATSSKSPNCLSAFAAIFFVPCRVMSARLCAEESLFDGVTSFNNHCETDSKKSLKRLQDHLNNICCKQHLASIIFVV